MNDNDLYKQTLDQYNDPAFARQYAKNIAHRVSEWMFKPFLSQIPQGKILDIACAAGRDSAYLRDKGYKVTGIDYSAELIAIARQSYPDVEFIQGDFMELPFQGNTFNGLWCRAALVHLPSQEMVEKALAEFLRVLKPSGIIMILTKARLPNQSATAIKKDALSNTNRYFRYQTETDFINLCEKAGFKLIEHKIYHEKDDADLKLKRDENWLFVIARK